MKNNKFWLTDIKDNKKPKDMMKSTINTRNSKSVDLQKKNSAFITKNEKNFFETKKTMIEYLINEETQYIDLFKCQDFYKQIAYKNYNNYNTNQSELKKKRQLINSMDNQIESVNIHLKKEIISITKLRKEELENYYEKIILDLTKKMFNYFYF